MVEKAIVFIEEKDKERFVKEIEKWISQFGDNFRDIKYSIGTGSTNEGIINDVLYTAIIIHDWKI